MPDSPAWNQLSFKYVTLCAYSTASQAPLLCSQKGTERVWMHLQLDDVGREERSQVKIVVHNHVACDCLRTGTTNVTLPAMHLFF